MFIRNTLKGWLPLLVALAGQTACSDDDKQADTDQAGRIAAALDVAHEAAATYGRVVLASYEDSLSGAEALDEAATALVQEPTEANLESARQAWLASREPYLQTEVYRFYGGPIDDDDGPEGQLNAWPLDELYIDYVEGDSAAGIVNDTQQEISAAGLLELNEQGGEKNIATGYHAVEFLLWGQDLSADGAGQRPYTDYVTDGSGTAENQDRRGQYLTTVSALLVEQLSQLVEEWAEGADDNYRADFEAAKPAEQLRRMLTGMIILSGFETGGERLLAALDTGEQEDEHSCFSDNTHRDMVQDIRGVQNVYRGTYETSAGDTIRATGVREAVEVLDPELASELDQRIQESLDLALALRPPFDREIASDNPSGNARVQALIDSLATQEELLEEVFQKFALSIPEPPM